MVDQAHTGGTPSSVERLRPVDTSPSTDSSQHPQLSLFPSSKSCYSRFTLVLTSTFAAVQHFRRPDYRLPNDETHHRSPRRSWPGLPRPLAQVPHTPRNYCCIPHGYCPCGPSMVGTVLLVGRVLSGWNEGYQGAFTRAVSAAPIQSSVKRARHLFRSTVLTRMRYSYL